MIERDPAARQAAIRNIVIEHERFTCTVSAIERFHMPVRGGLHSVGTLSAVLGDSRTGKSFAADRYAKRFQPIVGAEGMELPVLFVDMPMEGSGGPRAILETLSNALGLPITLRMNNPTVISGILAAIVHRKVQHLILDEWDQVFRESHRALLGFARGLLRKILNLQTVSITCVGLHETYTLLQADKQLSGRGGLPHHVVRPYQWSIDEERGSFRVLCDAFDRMLPFAECAGLGNFGFAERLFWVCEGNIGRLKVIIEAACAVAINDGSAKVDLQHFADAYECRKAPGARFNPFMHDMSQAPPRGDKVNGDGAPRRPWAQHFTKRVASDGVRGLEDVD